MKRKKQQLKPPGKEVGTKLDPTIHYKLKVIAAQQSIPLNELIRRILTYYANAYMPSTPMPPLPNASFTNPIAHSSPSIEFQSTPYVDIGFNGTKHL
ncbi:hypothetical protein [Okeania sp. KiyG1]|uniref:hypothetical protein n=1 Tax=Okeania sp. KiyG1 TaxID=2720165 RepID=UPI001922CE30|nr:hypothetical protein [Okeania sp. KiyG1]GGA58659.1 hypothetical protein CYANOKiyG1_79940 [Okeania sp. KiyG1]